MSRVLIVVIVAVVLSTVVAAAVTYVVTRRRSAAVGAVRQLDAADQLQAAVDAALGQAVFRVSDELAQSSVAQRDAAIRAALEHAAVLNREQWEAAAGRNRDQYEAAAAGTTAELTAKKDVIEQGLSSVRDEMRGELTKLTQIVNDLGRTNAERFGQVDESLRSHTEVASALAESARALKEALANPQARGQWGERMAEDVLRLAGFTENVNYVKQTQLAGSSGRPDYTFTLPKNHELYMDVKFPMAAYLRYLESPTEAERQAHLKRFLSDVRLRVRELAKRDYGRESSRPSVDYVLMFLPNEQLAAFIHENDAGLVDEAMRQRVVMCSPLTLFAFLGVIRQAFDSFVLEQTSDQILQLLGQFSKEWDKYTDSTEKVKKRFDSVASEFDQLIGTRRRALERPLRHIEHLRIDRKLPVDGELFAEPDLDTSHLDNVRRLGA